MTLILPHKDWVTVISVRPYLAVELCCSDSVCTSNFAVLPPFHPSQLQNNVAYFLCIAAIFYIVSAESDAEVGCFSSQFQPSCKIRFCFTTQLHHQGNPLYNLWRPNRVIGIKTRYRIDGTGIESRWGRGSAHPLRRVVNKQKCYLSTGQLFFMLLVLTHFNLYSYVTSAKDNLSN
jgi:hypothetical protein